MGFVYLLPQVYKLRLLNQRGINFLFANPGIKFTDWSLVLLVPTFGFLRSNYKYFFIALLIVFYTADFQ